MLGGKYSMKDLSKLVELLKYETITNDDIDISIQDYHTRSIYGVHHNSNTFAAKEC